MDQTDCIQNMIQRVAQCRQLAAALSNEKAAKVMSQMADEGEVEIRRLLARRSIPGAQRMSISERRINRLPARAIHARHVNSSLRGARFGRLDMPGFGRRMDGLSGRRRSPREPVILAASAQAIGGSRSVLIADISATGARLRGRDLPPSATDVLITVGPIEIFATVNWRADDECGAEFDATLTPDVLSQIQEHGDWALVTGLRHP